MAIPFVFGSQPPGRCTLLESTHADRIPCRSDSESESRLREECSQFDAFQLLVSTLLIESGWSSRTSAYASDSASRSKHTKTECCASATVVRDTGQIGEEFCKEILFVHQISLGTWNFEERRSSWSNRKSSCYVSMV